MHRINLTQEKGDSMFSVRFVAPIKTQFVQVSAIDVVDAVSCLVERNLGHCLYVKQAHGNETAYFALVEVEGEGVFVGRHFYAGIGRKGGVTVKNSKERVSLCVVEQELNLPAGYLSENDWEGEESVEDARNRLR